MCGVSAATTTNKPKMQEILMSGFYCTNLQAKMFLEVVFTWLLVEWGKWFIFSLLLVCNASNCCFTYSITYRQMSYGGAILQVF